MQPWGESRRPHWEFYGLFPEAFVVLGAVREPGRGLVDFEFVYANAAAEAALAQPGRLLPGRRLLVEAPWAEEAGLLAFCQQVAEERTPRVVELTRVRVEGPLRWRAKAAPYEDGLVLALEDVSAQAAREAALLQERNLLRSVLEATTDCVYVKDLEGRYTLANSAAAHALGCASPEQLLGRTDLEVQPEDAAASSAHDRAVLRSGQVATYEDTDSHQRTWLTTKGVLRDAGGHVRGLFGISRDVTAHRHAEALTHASEARYALVARATNDVLWDWDLISGEVQWNQALTPQLGWSPEEGRHSFQWWLERVHPEDLDRVCDGFQRVIDQACDTWQSEYRVRRRDGSFATVLERGHVARDRAGRPSRLIALLMDVSERRRQEEAREREAQERERFIGVLGHDLGNPLAAIRLSTAGLLRRAALAGDHRVALQRIDASAERMARMVEQLRDFTRARMGAGLPVERQPVELRELCARVIGELELAYPERKVEFEVRGDSGGQWDAQRLAQVLSNLVANALEHSPPDSPVRVALADVDGVQQVEVHNGGPPIPEDLQARLFEPFHGRRTHEGPSRQAGLGLGLYIVKEIVRAHGGDVSVHSSAADGTRFRLLLPRLTARS